MQTINFLVVEKKGYETSSIRGYKFGDVFGSVFSSRLSSSDFFLGGGGGGGRRAQLCVFYSTILIEVSILHANDFQTRVS